MSTVETFLTEMCESDAGAVTRAGLLYEAYLAWCENSGCRFTMSRPRFHVVVEQTMPVTVTRLVGPQFPGAKVYKGLRLRGTPNDRF